MVKNRLDALDGLRGVLAVTVMISHLVGSVIGWHNTRPFIGAYLSVIYFFMMSGFVLSYAHNTSTKFTPYLLTRLARLLPLHIISTLLIILVFYYNSKHGGYVPNDKVFHLNTIMKNILFANGIYPKEFYIINAPSWSISIEFWCSLLIPIFFNRMKFLFKIILSVFLFTYLIFISPKGFEQSMLVASLSMLVGAVCFDLSQMKTMQDHINDKNFLIFITFSFITCLLGIYIENHTRGDFLYFIVFIPLLFIDFTPKEFFLRRLLSSSFFSFLGFISFPLYLLHEIVIVSGLISKHDTYLSILIGACISIFVAYLYARYIDFYMYRFLKEQIKKYGKTNG